MAEPPDTFRRAPKRKSEKAKRVSMSPEAKQAYELLMKERDEREKAYNRHLPPDSNRR